MEDYYYLTYGPDQVSDWIYVFGDSPDIWMYHDMELCQYIASQQSAINHSIIIYNASEKKPVAICPLFIYKQRNGRLRLSKKIATSFQAGPALIKKIGPKKRREVFHYIDRVITNLMATQKIDVCSLSSTNLSEYNLTIPNFYTNPLHELRENWQNHPMAYYYLNLKRSEEELRADLETRARTIITKFEKAALCEIKKATVDDAEIIYNLYLETSKRAGLPLHPKSDAEWWLKYTYAPHYVAYVNGIPAAAVRLHVFRQSAYYANGFTSNDFIKMEVNTYLLWKCILLLKEQGINDFSLGLEEFKPTGSKWDNIAKFKRSFGGELRYKFDSVHVSMSPLKKLFSKLADIL